MVNDFLWHIPHNILDRSQCPLVQAARPGEIATLQVRIARHLPPSNPRLPYRIIAYDESGEITLSFFNAKGDYLTRQYPTNTDLLISGRIEFYRHELQMPHPDYAVPLADADKIPRFEPVYHLTDGVSGRQMRRFVQEALRILPCLPEWLDARHLHQQNWPTWHEAVTTLHNPLSLADVAPSSPARRRLAYDELLANQLAMHVLRRHHRQRKGRSFLAKDKLTDRLLSTLPFTLTVAQTKVWADIRADLENDQLMLRLLQGDVGSGKTVIALLAMLHVMAAGSQSALLAPTEILAKQHHFRLQQFLAPLGINIGLLIGKMPAKEKTAITTALRSGELSLVVGTHALIQDTITFRDLALAVVDEQHRFGVQQRAALAEKGRGVAILAMTATPIPRTLTLTAYGDMEVSVLDSKPPGRQPIDTRLIDLARLEEIVSGLQRALAQGRQVYWVCPLVHESEFTDLANATERARLLSETLGNSKVGLIHGQMAPAERDAVMARFVTGNLQVLVATTVIEVGVDVPNASLMIIEHAERFGLAQLHQLRGRVGRGASQSNCLLLYQAPLSEIGKARLQLLRETEDGFRLAEEDLRLRGPGEMLGTRQSGLPEYRLADLSTHHDLLLTARDEAKLILHQDSLLESARGQAMRTLLYLFHYDHALKLLRGG